MSIVYTFMNHIVPESHVSQNKASDQLELKLHIYYYELPLGF